jgi:hypothetical protein
MHATPTARGEPNAIVLRHAVRPELVAPIAAPCGKKANQHWAKSCHEFRHDDSLIERLG